MAGGVERRCKVELERDPKDASMEGVWKAGKGSRLIRAHAGQQQIDVKTAIFRILTMFWVASACAVDTERPPPGRAFFSRAGLQACRLADPTHPTQSSFLELKKRVVGAVLPQATPTSRRPPTAARWSRCSGDKFRNNLPGVLPNSASQSGVERADRSGPSLQM
jgi:hypothetical protein